MKDKSQMVSKDDNGKDIKRFPAELPPGWKHISGDGVGPFVTKAILRHPEGRIVTWKSRDTRKRHSVLEVDRGSTWWAPGAVGWWIGVLFAIGASCFAIASLPYYSLGVGRSADGITFFIGSLFFTTAAFLQYFEAANALESLKIDGREIKFFTWEPKRIDWWSTLVQLTGTLFFNINTFEAINNSFIPFQVNRFVWTPDVLGSVCFLLASSLAWFEVVHSLWAWKYRNISWWIVALNLLGSIAFGISAICAYTILSTGYQISAVLVNTNTFIGAICFFVGALLLLPERTN